MGVDVYATHNIAGTLTTFAFTIGTGFATAATATIGQAIGNEEEPTRHSSSFRHSGDRCSSPAVSSGSHRRYFCYSSGWKQSLPMTTLC